MAVFAVLSLGLLGSVGATAEEAGSELKDSGAGQANLAAEGKSLFNQYCSHCHGFDAIQGERPRDLRRLKRRYGDGARDMFYTTINNGRMDKGMPVWKGVLSEEVMGSIYAFLQSVQTE